MQPENDQPKPQPSLDGIHKQPIPPQSQPTPDYRPDHELPAPEVTPLLEPTNGQAHVDEQTLQSISMSHDTPPVKKNWRKWIITAVIGILVALIAVFITSYVWYLQQLAPVSTDTTKHVRVTISTGMSPNAIGESLKSAGVIRSKLAFTIYTKLSKTENNLKAGVYNIQPSLSTQGIVNHLVLGKQDTFDVTFLPGDTLANDRQKLIDLGYSATDVDAALNKTYDRPLFATKPASTDLEGYMYGETIEFDSSATVGDILNRFFDEYEGVVTDNNLVAGFQKQGLSLYEGITLASIVQREVSNTGDQAQVARVFLNRLAAGMTLGSDVTYQYAAKKLGVEPTPTLDSPYNTRINTGLPPGPIATPGKSALLAVANPATNDYLFFLSGDDDVTYFAKTDAQHQQNIAEHCQKKCSIN